MTLPLDDWERLAEEATPGPWNAEALNWLLRHERKHGVIPWDLCDDQSESLPTDGDEWVDARFIAAARTAVPALCKRVRELEQAERAAATLRHVETHAVVGLAHSTLAELTRLRAIEAAARAYVTAADAHDARDWSTFAEGLPSVAAAYDALRAALEAKP